MSHRRRRRRRRVHRYFVWNVRNGEPEENVCIEENKKYRLWLAHRGGWPSNLSYYFRVMRQQRRCYGSTSGQTYIHVICTCT